MGTISITRDDSRWRDRFRKYRIFVDDVRVGTVGRGETATVEAAPGPRTVEMRVDWGRSAPLSVTVAEGEVVKLVCGPNSSAVNALGALLKPGTMLYLNRAS